ncbi:hypothetical protein ACFWVC_33670 [Streptomyces sp. NPDC058691]|uniref:hypothetical protein n=1 Tax=Streptomyces sp. NPDC058691 TaxID=3346601 RepID=UPI003661DE88
MAEWATYVIAREDGGHEVYEARFGAVGLDLDLLAGPDVLVPLLRSRGVAEWRDEGLCQAAALIDLRSRTLLFFAWEGPITQMRHRAVMWDALRGAWPGWELLWTYDGPAELRTHLGLDPEDVRYRGGRTIPDAALGVDDEELAERDPMVRVVTVGADRCYVLSAGNDHPVAEGPAVLERLAGAPDHHRCEVAAESGLHVDPDRRRVGWWLLGAAARAPEMASRWPGWTVEFWQDRWEEHIRASAGRFSPPAAIRWRALAELRNEARERRSALGAAVLRTP